MTTATVRAAAQTTATADAARAQRPVASGAARTLRYALATTRATLQNVPFVFFTLALPVIMLLMVNGIFGAQAPEEAKAQIATQITMNMAAYGGLTAAINAGAMIQLERANGWLRQLMVAGMTPGTFVIGKVTAAMAVALPVLLAVVTVGIVAAGVREAALPLLGAIALLWILLVPMVLLGLVLGLLVKPSAVSAVATIGTILLAVSGGLWFPTMFFPQWLAELSLLTPTHWLGVMPQAVLAGDPLPMRGVLTTLIWVLALAVIAALLLRRGARTASRR